METYLNNKIVQLWNCIRLAEKETIDALIEADTSAFLHENETNDIIKEHKLLQEVLHMTIVCLEESLEERNLAHEVNIMSVEERNLALEARIRALLNAYKTSNIVVSLPQDLDPTKTSSREKETAHEQKGDVNDSFKSGISTINDSATKKDETKESLLQIFDSLTPKDTKAEWCLYPTTLFKHCEAFDKVFVPSKVSEKYDLCDDNASMIFRNNPDYMQGFVRSIICLAFSGKR